MAYYKTRDELIQQMFKQVTSGGYCSLVGPEGRGKTSLLLQLKDFIQQKRDDCRLIWIDMASIDMTSIQVDAISDYLRFVLKKIISNVKKISIIYILLYYCCRSQ